MKLFLAAAGAALLLSTAPPQEPKKGRFKATFTERHPLSSVAEFCRRSGWTVDTIRKNDDKGGEYDVAQESFEVYVPASYRPEVPHGLFVYISSVNSGGPDGGWTAVLDKYALLWVGANNSGNERSIWYRTNLALDAAHNMKQRYAIDEERIYISGPSGGGRSASRTGFCYPDVFSCGYYLIGCDYFRDIPTPDGKGYFRADFAPAPAALMERMKARNRFAIFTGDKDHMKPGCLAAFKAMQQDKFAYASYFEAPNWGHTHPNAEWFEKGIAAIEAPLVDAAKAAWADGQKLEASGKARDALAAYARAAGRGFGQPFQAPARAKVDDLRPKIEAESQAAYEKLTATRPATDKIRAFAREWAGFAGGRKASDEADRIGQEELKGVVAKSGFERRRALQKFIAEWEGFAPSRAAREALDREADKELEKTAKGAGTGKARHSKLLAFAKDWAPSPAAERAIAEVDAEAQKLLEEIRQVKGDRERLAQLVPFSKFYEATPAGKAARQLADALAKKVK
jgi:hypothetical protein